MRALGHSLDFGSFLLPDGPARCQLGPCLPGQPRFPRGLRRVPDRSRRAQPEADLEDALQRRSGRHRRLEGHARARLERAQDRGPTCDGTPVPAGFEGMHIFDISDIRDPELVGEVELSARPEADTPGCGTHTLTLVPDGDRAVIYNATSGGNPALPNPAVGSATGSTSSRCRATTRAPPATCAACRSRAATRLTTTGSSSARSTSSPWPPGTCRTCSTSVGTPPRAGASRIRQFLYTIEEQGVCNTGGPLCNGNWHSAGFTWDGEVVIMGWEPGGGSRPSARRPIRP